MRKRTWAIGSAADDDGAGPDMFMTSDLSFNDMFVIEDRQVIYRKSIKP
jgi:hypothetical protein